MVQVTGHWNVVVPTKLSWFSQIPEGSSLRDSGMPFRPTDRSTIHSLKLYSLVGTIFISGKPRGTYDHKCRLQPVLGR